MAEPKKKPDSDEVDIFTLLEEIEKKKQPAIDSLLAQRSDIDQKLARLGYKEATVAPVTPKTAPSKGVTRQRDPEALCSYCGQPGHDARKHRMEIIAKRKAEAK